LKYVVDSGTKACVACPDNATACTVASGTATVTTCTSGYVKGTTNLTCLSCAGLKDAFCVATSASLVECQVSSADCTSTTGATACNDGYFLDTTTATAVVCTACSANTKTCSAATTSTACYDGYLLASTACASKCTDPTASGCAGAKCSTSGKRYLSATTTEMVATTTTTTCIIITDTLTTANGVQTAATGIVSSCNNGY
jgi:hypothetical protein